MDTADWSPALIWALVLLAGAVGGWLLSLGLTRWMDKRRPTSAQPPGRPSWVVDAPAPAQRPAAPAPAANNQPDEEDEWPDTVMVAPGGASIETALNDEDADLSPNQPGLSARHAQGLLLLAQRRYESAWGALQELPPDAAPVERLVKPLDRLATAFESTQRFDLARDVYERLADISPNAPELKPRLVRARGLAMAVQSGTLDLNAPPPQASDTPGTTDTRSRSVPKAIGRFIIQRELGRGAMGAVYLAHDPNRSASVALKTLALSREFNGPELQDARARFFREAEMAGRLEHPNIVRIFEAGEADGLAYISMELVSGQDLSHYTDPAKLLPPALVLRMICRAADALAYAHSKGVTHRDIKPANIMVDLGSDTVKIMDFGVARIADSTRTRTGIVLGTPSFMAPELLAGQRIDGRVDLYALGVTLFQLLTGKLPFFDPSMARLMRAIANDPAPDVRTLQPHLPEALANIVALALEKHPETRYANGTQMAADLRAVAAALSNPVENPQKTAPA